MLEEIDRFLLQEGSREELIEYIKQQRDTIQRLSRQVVQLEVALNRVRRLPPPAGVSEESGPKEVAPDEIHAVSCHLAVSHERNAGTFSHTPPPPGHSRPDEEIWPRVHAACSEKITSPPIMEGKPLYEFGCCCCSSSNDPSPSSSFSSWSAIQRGDPPSTLPPPPPLQSAAPSGVSLARPFSADRESCRNDCLLFQEPLPLERRRSTPTRSTTLSLPLSSLSTSVKANRTSSLGADKHMVRADSCCSSSCFPWASPAFLPCFFARDDANIARDTNVTAMRKKRKSAGGRSAGSYTHDTPTEKDCNPATSPSTVAKDNKVNDNSSNDDVSASERRRRRSAICTVAPPSVLVNHFLHHHLYVDDG